MAEVLEGMVLPSEDVQGAIVVDQGLAGAGGVEELGGGAPLLSSSGSLLLVDGSQVAQGAVGLHQLVVGLPDPGHHLG